MRLRALGAASAVSAITAGVVVAGSGTLVSPPIRHPASLPHWWQSVGPLMGVFSILRLAVIASGAYSVLLLGLIAAAGPVAGEQGPRLVARTHLLGARRALTLALGASAAGALVAGCASAGSRAPLVPRPVLTYVGPVSPASGPSSRALVARNPGFLPVLLPTRATRWLPVRSRRAVREPGRPNPASGWLPRRPRKRSGPSGQGTTCGPSPRRPSRGVSAELRRIRRSTRTGRR